MINDPDIFHLTPGEKSSSVWEKIRSKLRSMLSEAREKNDEALDEKTTAQLRGEISILKEILDWDVERTTLR